MKNDKEKTEKGTEITRKDALKKMGYAALTATTFMALLNSPRTAAASSASPEAPPPPSAPGGSSPWD
jgi:hypothetical protein